MKAVALPLHRLYNRPKLLADSVRPVGVDGVELRRGERVLSLTVEGARDLAVSHLVQLQNGGLEQPGPLDGVAAELDALGWIGEGQPRKDSAAADQNALVARGRHALAELDPALRVALARRLRASPRARPRCVEDVLTDALRVQLARESPLFLPVLEQMLAADPAPPGVAALPSWAEDFRELEIGIAGLIYWALRGLRSPMPLPQGSAMPTTMPTMGARFPMGADVALRDMEAMLRDWNAAAPAPAILAAGRPRRQAQRIAQGIHLQQYYVSLKYVESLLPVLARSAAPPLRAVLWQYLQEELGHEDYELAACRQLGLTEAQVRANMPLPAFSAFHRLMAYAAAEHPLAWVMALPLAEGLPNERKPLPELLARHGLQDPAFSEHVALDETMDHAWMARRIAACLGPVDAAQWRRAVVLVAALWRLTQCGWEQVVARFGAARSAPIIRSPWDWRHL